MKRMFLRAGLALACGLALAGCNSNKGSLTLAGRISGLTTDGLVLQNVDGQTFLANAGATYFNFANLIGYDVAFDVTIKTQPANAVCSVTGGKGTSTPYNVSSVVVTCLTNNYYLGGSITNLGSASGLVLANGADTLSVQPGATVFRMPEKVSLGANYGVVVFQQPTGKTCVVSNGVGTMPANDLNNIVVTCQ